MRAVYVAGVVIAAASLSGCDIGDFQSIPDNQFSMQRDLNRVMEQQREFRQEYANDQLSDFNNLAKDVATSGRLAKIAANIMNKSSSPVLSNENERLLNLISSELKDDMYREVFYSSIVQQGFAFENVPISNNRGFEHQGQWLLNTLPNSYFSSAYPTNSVKLFPYESINKPNCVDSEAKALHSLLTRKGANVNPDFSYELVDTGSAWLVKYRSGIDEDSIKAYRVLVQVVCSK